MGDLISHAGFAVVFLFSSFKVVFLALIVKDWTSSAVKVKIFCFWD